MILAIHLLETNCVCVNFIGLCEEVKSRDCIPCLLYYVTCQHQREYIEMPIVTLIKNAHVGAPKELQEKRCIYPILQIHQYIVTIG